MKASWQGNMSVNLSLWHPFTSKQQAQQLISKKQIQSSRIGTTHKVVPYLDRMHTT